MTTPNLSLPELVASQSQPHVPLNAALRRLDALVQLTVISISNAPPGSPSDGDRYIVGSSPSGAWVGHESDVAAYIGTGWAYFTPAAGWLAFVQNLSALHIFGAGSPIGWDELTTGGGGGGGGGFDPLTTFEYYNDFNYVDLAQHTGNYGGWYTLSNGTALALEASTAKHPGILRHQCTSNTHYSINLYGTGTGGGWNNFQLATGVTLELEAMVRFPTLPDGTDTYTAFVGLGEQNNATDGIRMYVNYDSGTAKWMLYTVKNSTSTTNQDNVGSTPPVADQWHHLKLVATTAAATMYVDGTQVLENTTNIPTDPMTIYNTMAKSAGSNARYMDLDFVRLRITCDPDRTG